MNARTTCNTLSLAGSLSAAFLMACACTTQAPRKLYMDVHHLGPGKVTAAAVAEAHLKDLAIQGRYDVDYRRYWVDEAGGTIYCLVEAPCAEAACAVHREAHGLVADEVVEVQEGILPAEGCLGAKLFMDTHQMEPGSVHPEDVAEAHRKDLAIQQKHGVRFLDHWYDEATGRIHCLAEAPSREALIATHREAHGLIPDSVCEVVEGS